MVHAISRALKIVHCRCIDACQGKCRKGDRHGQKVVGIAVAADIAACGNDLAIAAGRFIPGGHVQGAGKIEAVVGVASPR